MPETSSPPGDVRVAVISTPRTGNTWLRHLLTTAYKAQARAVHDLDEITHEALPPRLVMQLHARRDERFVGWLAEHSFAPVVMVRHPLDVLVSILQFATHEPQTARWLGGQGGSEAGIAHANPRSRDFLNYATGPRAAALLAVSLQWCQAGGCHAVRYEELVADCLGELRRLGIGIGHPRSDEDWQRAIAANAIESLRATTNNRHYWKGQPGLWRKLLPAGVARRIAAAHPDYFERLGYICDPDETLDDYAAHSHWLEATAG